MSGDYEHALGGLRGHIVYGEQTAGETPLDWVQVKVALPYLRDAERALIAERARADAAEAECAGLRAIVEGRTTAPTIKEARAHCHGTRGTFVVTLGDTAHGGAHCRARVATGLQRFSEQPQRWIALDANGRPCPWPVPA